MTRKQADTKKLRKLLADKMSVAKKAPIPINRPTPKPRQWWLVDVEETRTLRILATGPKHARDIAARAITELYPPTAFDGEPNVVVSFAHSIKCDEGRVLSKVRMPR